ncbi:MAG: hypothetical protein PWP51_1241 [Clostridiales bacterium]|nr:hypothetical protein [Clostridiales bacterium]MDN5298688.1 hypothetical protein [Clostridiales bacterium]
MFIWIIVIIAIYYFYTHRNSDGKWLRQEAPSELLKMRYVRGEIDEETYRRMKEMIK